MMRARRQHGLSMRCWALAALASTPTPGRGAPPTQVAQAPAAGVLLGARAPTALAPALLLGGLYRAGQWVDVLLEVMADVTPQRLSSARSGGHDLDRLSLDLYLAPGLRRYFRATDVVRPFAAVSVPIRFRQAPVVSARDRRVTNGAYHKELSSGLVAGCGVEWAPVAGLGVWAQVQVEGQALPRAALGRLTAGAQVGVRWQLGAPMTAPQKLSTSGRSRPTPSRGPA